MGPSSRPRQASALVREIGGTLKHYAAAQFRICLILTCIYAAGFALAKVPLWPLMAPLAGFAHIIPTFGAVVAIVVIAAISGIARGIYPALGVVLVFAVAQALEGFYLTPRIMGRRLRLSPWVVFFGVLAASSLFGFAGVLLAVPVMAVAMVIWRFFQHP